MAQNVNHERHGAPSSSNGTPEWHTNPVDLWSPFLSSMQQWSGAVVPKVTMFSSEWMAFVQRRLHEDFALPQHLVYCKAPGEIVQTYSDFMRRAMDDYQQQFQEIARIGAASTNDLGDLGHSRLEEPGERPARESRVNPQTH